MTICPSSYHSPSEKITKVAKILIHRKIIYEKTSDESRFKTIKKTPLKREKRLSVRTSAILKNVLIMAL